MILVPVRGDRVVFTIMEAVEMLYGDGGTLKFAFGDEFPI